MQIRNQEDIRQLGTIMGIWAHPDDETYTSAGIMAAATSNGQTVICVTATRGERGGKYQKSKTNQSLARQRELELSEALKILGIKYHHWLGYEDGTCESANSREASEQISKLIDHYAPDTILTFGKDGITGHSDHCCISCWVDESLEINSRQPKVKVFHAVHTRDQYDKYLKSLDKKFDIFFNTDEPIVKQPQECDILLELPTDYRLLKYQAIACMTSQYEDMLHEFSQDFIQEAFGEEAFVAAKG